MCRIAASKTSELPADYTVPALEHVVPNTEISKGAFALASSLLPLPLLNHSIRVYVYAKALAPTITSERLDLLFTACILHDIGTCDKYDGPERFEVEGANAAASFLESKGVPKEDVRDVWLAIALHTSGGIAENAGDVACLVRRGVMLDFGFLQVSDVLRSEKDRNLKGEIEKEYPRLNVEKVLCDAVVEQAKRNPKKAPKVTWPGSLYEAYLADPEWEGVNKGFVTG
jgi:hypothetical protein